MIEWGHISEFRCARCGGHKAPLGQKDYEPCMCYEVPIDKALFDALDEVFKELLSKNNPLIDSDDKD